MSNQMAMLNLWIACHSLVTHNVTDSGTTIYVPPEISNTSGMLNLYMACKYLEPRMLEEMHTRDGKELSTNDITTVFNIYPRMNFGSLTKTSELPEGYIKFADVGAAYKVYNLAKSWNEARKYCLNENAQLAVTNSLEKIRHVQSFFRSNDVPILVGLHRRFDDSEWVELGTGKSATSLFENSDLAQNLNQYAAIINQLSATLSGVNGLSRYHFACEIPI